MAFNKPASSERPAIARRTIFYAREYYTVGQTSHPRPEAMPTARPPPRRPSDRSRETRASGAQGSHRIRRPALAPRPNSTYYTIAEFMAVSIEKSAIDPLPDCQSTFPQQGPRVAGQPLSRRRSCTHGHEGKGIEDDLQNFGSASANGASSTAPAVATPSGDSSGHLHTGQDRKGRDALPEQPVRNAPEPKAILPSTARAPADPSLALCASPARRRYRARAVSRQAKGRSPDCTAMARLPSEQIPFNSSLD